MINYEWLFTVPIAHRGLHDANTPENSLAAFRKAVEKGYNIEIDIHILKDGEIAVFHDSNLLRMCGVKQKISLLDSSALGEYRLKGTDEHIPTLKELLRLIDGKVGLVIEIKSYKSAVGKALYEYIEALGYTGKYAVQSFFPHSLLWFRRNTADIPIGILTFNYRSLGLFGLVGRYFSNGAKRKAIKPDFISFKIKDIPYSGLTKQREKGMKVITWTVDTPEKLKTARNHADNIIFEIEDILNQPE
jgi:glycerophosphoryl diester phosphodiesterase